MYMTGLSKSRPSRMSGHTEHWLKSEVRETGRFPLADDLADFCGSSFVDSFVDQFEFSIQLNITTQNRTCYAELFLSDVKYTFMTTVYDRVKQ